jgi:hypothetical protein
MPSSSLRVREEIVSQGLSISSATCVRTDRDEGIDVLGVSLGASNRTS